MIELQTTNTYASWSYMCVLFETRSNFQLHSTKLNWRERCRNSRYVIITNCVLTSVKLRVIVGTLDQRQRSHGFRVVWFSAGPWRVRTHSNYHKNVLQIMCLYFM